MTLKILITGSNGQLGRELVLEGQKIDFEIIATGHAELDITKPAQIEKQLAQYQPALVVNTAAYTAVDAAESDPDIAFRVNRDGPANLAAACVEMGIPLIQISTDYVFNGRKKKPYAESDPVSPLGVYARSKAAGEDQVRSLLPAHIILRTSWLYGVFGRNFVKTMMALGKEKKVIKVVDDQFGSPTSAKDLAEAVLTLARHIKNGSDISWGTYHYCGQGITTWEQFAEEIFDIMRKSGCKQVAKVAPITTAEFPTVAKRPFFSVLDCSLVTRQFGIHLKPWQESLKTAIDRIIHDGEK